MRSHFSYYSLHTKLLQNQFTHCTYPLTSSNVATHFQHATFILNTLYPPPPQKKKNIKLSAVPCFPILNSSRLSLQESTFSTASRTAKQFSSNLSLPYSISLSSFFRVSSDLKKSLSTQSHRVALFHRHVSEYVDLPLV